MLTRPGKATFDALTPDANWPDVFIGLVALGVFDGFVTGLFANYDGYYYGSIGDALVRAVLFPIILVIGFFIGAAIYFAIARALGGTGTFLPYCYAILLFGVPLSGIIAVGQVVPYIGVLIVLAAAVYETVLAVYATMSVHRMSGQKATLAVLLPTVVLIALAFVLFLVVLVGLLALLSAPR